MEKIQVTTRWFFPASILALAFTLLGLVASNQAHRSFTSVTPRLKAVAWMLCSYSFLISWCWWQSPQVSVICTRFTVD